MYKKCALCGQTYISIVKMYVTEAWFSCIFKEVHIYMFSGEGHVAVYATPNPILLNKICLNQAHIHIYPGSEIE